MKIEPSPGILPGSSMGTSVLQPSKQSLDNVQRRTTLSALSSDSMINSSTTASLLRLCARVFLWRAGARIMFIGIASAYCRVPCRARRTTAWRCERGARVCIASRRDHVRLHIVRIADGPHTLVVMVVKATRYSSQASPTPTPSAATPRHCRQASCQIYVRVVHAVHTIDMHC